MCPVESAAQQSFVSSIFTTHKCTLKDKQIEIYQLTKKFNNLIYIINKQN
jgi:hypothetical protein